MDTVIKFGRTAVDTTDNGTEIRLMDRVSLYMPMVMSTRVSGIMTRHTDMEPTDMLMEPLMSESGQKISNMVVVSRNGLMVPSTRACTKMAKSTEMVP